MKTNNDEYLHVDYVASRIARLYENIRHVIDYQEEHLLRENALERGFRRRLLLKHTPPPFALDFVEELIRSGYFPNDTILQSKVSKVQEILDRYIETIRILGERRLANKDFLNFLYGIAACEIEEFLDPPSKELLLLRFEYDTLKSQLEISGTQIKEEEKDMLLFIAVNQTLLRASQSRIYFRLMQNLYPEWFEKQASQIEEYIPMMLRAKSQLDSLYQHFAVKDIRNRVRRFAIIFNTLSDISHDDPERLAELSRNSDELSSATQRSYMDRFLNLKLKMRRSGFRYVFSIFFGKILVALAIELPFELFLTGQIMFSALSFSILFPPALMFLAVLTIRMPTWNHREELMRQITAILNGTFQYEPIIIHGRKRRIYTSFIITILYIGILIFSFWGIITGLRALYFNPLSIAIFLVFLSLIIFSITRIKQWAKELYVGPEKEGVLEFIFDAVSFPIVGFGKFLSGEFRRFNFLILLVNLIFEAPFQSFVQFIEEWRKFIREKKEEL